ncbi:MAG: RluA family pseudouridine synthase [Holosporales bacterium]|jgi:23S rRNA pseudouridine1911/1915/1917 synthase|nr:RluA family pseudouridine synthase [Holosporales bacterium]
MKISIPIREKKYDGMRLDLAAVMASGRLSRTQFQKYLRQGSVRLNGEVADNPSMKISTPCLIEIEIAPILPEYSIEPENIPIDTIFEDDHIIVINKEAGMVCHPAPGHRSGTLVNAIINKMGNRLPMAGEKTRPGIVHRLDKDTSGLMLVAKTERAHFEFSRLFAEGKGRLIHRRYICFVFGTPAPKTGRIETFIKRHPKLRQQYTTCSESGKFAITLYSTERSIYLTSTKSIAKVNCELLTGRTHQIRVHMQHLGTPIIGDATYGLKKVGTSIYPAQVSCFPRQALHSAKLSFKHPITNDDLEFTAELPEDMAILEAMLR